jgi:hypothetical protein
VVVDLDQGVMKVEIENVKEVLDKLNSDMEDNRKYINQEIEKIKTDFRSLMVEHYRIRESVLEIKNSVERSIDLTAIRMDNLQKTLNEFIEDRKSHNKSLFYPMIVAILMGVISYVAGKII